MKRTLYFLSFLVLFVSCRKELIQKPENLIEQDKMVSIIYDLALLDAIRAQNSSEMQNNNPMKFIYKKYKIDSLQFVKSNRYYASDINNFKKMYEEVGNKIDSKKTFLDSLDKKNKTKTVNKQEEGVVK